MEFPTLLPDHLPTDPETGSEFFHCILLTKKRDASYLLKGKVEHLPHDKFVAGDITERHSNMWYAEFNLWVEERGEPRGLDPGWADLKRVFESLREYGQESFENGSHAGSAGGLQYVVSYRSGVEGRVSQNNESATR